MNSMAGRAPANRIRVVALSPSTAAKIVCQVRNWQISNLELQKILYVAHMVHLGRYGRPLVNETFEAWTYGPVLPSLYRRVAMFGAEPIKNVFYAARVPEGGTERETLEAVARHLASMTPGQLVELTHWPKGAWAKVYQPGVRHIPIPDNLIADEFRARERSAA